MVCDCKAVVDGAARWDKPPNPKSLWGGLWKQIYSSIHGFTMEVVKVKAHKSLEQAIEDGQIEWFKGNDEADMDAKMITKKYRPSESDRTLYDFQAKVARSVLNRAINNCEAIDTAKMNEPIVVKTKRKGTNPRNTPTTPKEVHDFAWVGAHKFQCSKCFKCETKMPKPNLRCHAISQGMDTAISNGHSVGHLLNIADQFSIAEGSYLGPIVFCVKCGAYSVRRCKDLKRVCPGMPDKGPKERCVGAFAEHQHPNDSGIRLQGFRTLAHFDEGSIPERTSNPLGRVGSNLLEPEVWFDQDEEVEFGFHEEEGAWGQEGGEMPPEEPF